MWFLRILKKCLEWFGLSMDLATLWGMVGSATMTLGSILLLSLTSWYQAWPTEAKALLILIMLLSFLALIGHTAEAVKWWFGRKVELIPSGGPSPTMRLGVKNHRRGRNFSAECSMIAVRGDPNPLTKGVFALCWNDTEDREKFIPREGTSELLVGKLHTYPYPEEAPSWAQLDIVRWTSDGDANFTGARWNMSHDERTPEFDIEIRIFGEGFQHPHVERWTLRPVSPFGPLEMIRLGD